MAFLRSEKIPFFGGGEAFLFFVSSQFSERNFVKTCIII